MENNPNTTDHSNGADVLERRRFAPAPPCLPLDATGNPPGQSLRERIIESPIDRAALKRIATAIDVVHGFRLAHGHLNPDCVFFDRDQVWFADLGALWERESPCEPSPRKLDLKWFRDLCEKWLGPSAQTSQGQSAKAILEEWSHDSRAMTSDTPVVSETSNNLAHSTASAAKPETNLVAQPTNRRTILRNPVLGIVGCLVGMLLLLLLESVRTPIQVGVSKMIEILQLLQGHEYRPSSVSNGFSSTGRNTNLSTQQFMLNRASLIEALVSNDPASTDRLDEIINQNDATFHSLLAVIMDNVPEFHRAAVPRLHLLLKRPHTNSAQFALERSFIMAAGSDELATVRELLDSPRKDISIEACHKLAVLGQPISFDRLKSLVEKSSGTARTRYIEFAIVHFPFETIRPFIFAEYFNERGFPSKDFFSLLTSSASWAPQEGSRSENFRINSRRLLEETLQRFLAHPETSSDEDILKTLLCMANNEKLTPIRLFQRLSISQEAKSRLKDHVSRILVAEDGTRTLNAAWQPADSWLSAAISWSKGIPRSYLSFVLQRDIQIRGITRELSRQSKLLALAELPAEPFGESLAEELEARLDAYSDVWRLSQPESLFGVVSAITSLNTPTAQKAVSRYFSGPAEERPVAAWDGFLLGAVSHAQLHRDLLNSACQHPYPTIHRRARVLAALSRGDVQGIRSINHGETKIPLGIQMYRDRLNRCQSEYEAQLELSRQRTGVVQEIALGLSSSDGATAALHQRVDHRQSPYATFSALANQPRPLDRRRFDDFVHGEPPYELLEQVIMLAAEVRGDASMIDAMINLATSMNSGRTLAPIGHRATAVYVIGSLRRCQADSLLIRKLLDIARDDSCILVRCSAALAAVQAVKPDEKSVILDFVSDNPELDESVRHILGLAKNIP